MMYWSTYSLSVHTCWQDWVTSCQNCSHKWNILGTKTYSWSLKLENVVSCVNTIIRSEESPYTTKGELTHPVLEHRDSKTNFKLQYKIWVYKSCYDAITQLCKFVFDNPQFSGIRSTVRLRFRKCISGHHFHTIRKLANNDFQYHKEVIYNI